MNCVPSLRYLVGLLLCALLWVTPLKAEGFAGDYHGIAAAAGMSLSLQEMGERLVGQLAAADGHIYTLTGVITDKTKNKKSAHSAQGDLRVGGVVSAVAFFRVEMRPLGVQFLFIPVTDSGAPDMLGAQDYSFLAQGAIKQTADRATKSATVAAPKGKVDVLDFIDKYPQWSSRDVARLYGQLSDKDRGLIEIYDHAGGEILWRVCSTNPPNDVVTPTLLSELLDRQNSSCAELLSLAEQAQKGGLFSEFLRRARFQFGLIRETVLCDRSRSSPDKCADVSTLGAPLIVNWRELKSIFKELLPDEVVTTMPISELAPAVVSQMKSVAAPHDAKIPLPPLRLSLADRAEGAATAPVKRTRPGKRTRLEKVKEGRFIAKERRRNHPLPLSNPRK